MSVVAILAKNLGSDYENAIGILSDVVDLPKEVKEFIQQKVPTFKKVYSKTIEHKYYGNTCPKCGMLTGDFFLHSEPGAPFFPTQDKEAKLLYMTEIPLVGEILIKAGIAFGIGEIIFENAKRI